MKKKKLNKNIIYISLVLLAVLAIFLFANNVLTKTLSVTYDPTANSASTSAADFLSDAVNLLKNEEPKSDIKYVKTPTATKAIYMTACVASTVTFKKELVDLIDSTEINSIIIDIKDFTGTIAYDTGKNMEGEKGSGCRAKDMQDFVKLLHDKGIYVIGRVTVFQDPFYSKLHPELAVKKASDGSVWKDHKGLNFIDVGAKPYWDYIIELAENSHKAGFDEINFDYIRFPSDGDMKDIYFSHAAEVLKENPTTGKQIALENFFKYLRENIDEYNISAEKEGRNKLVISADLFGMVTTNYDDLNIGQVLERALPYFDFVAPMVYPSHYPVTFNGWADPNKVPYDLIHFVMGTAVKRVEALKNATTTPESVRNFVSTDQLRPWLQDFDYGGNYGPKEVRNQIQATYDVGLDSWMLWAPSNKYTVEALKTE
jgi:hypothetical protein